MEKEKISKAIKEAIIEVTNLKVESETLSLVEDLEMDSLDYVEVIMKVEQKLDRGIPDEVVFISPGLIRITTVGELIEVVEKYINK